MLTIDASQVISFGEQLRDVPKELRPRLRKAIVSAGDAVAAQARSNAAWSTRIPSAIKTRVRFGSSAGVRVVVDSKKAPHARPFEGIGSRDRDFRGGTFRHPVFGRDRWVEQQQRPFLVPALQAKQDEAVRAVQEAIDSAFSF